MIEPISLQHGSRSKQLTHKVHRQLCSKCLYHLSVKIQFVFRSWGRWCKSSIHFATNFSLVIYRIWTSPSGRQWAWTRWSGRRPASLWRSDTTRMAADALHCGPPLTGAVQSKSGCMSWLEESINDRINDNHTPSKVKGYLTYKITSFTNLSSWF